MANTKHFAYTIDVDRPAGVRESQSHEKNRETCGFISGNGINVSYLTFKWHNALIVSNLEYFDLQLFDVYAEQILGTLYFLHDN